MTVRPPAQVVGERAFDTVDYVEQDWPPSHGPRAARRPSPPRVLTEYGEWMGRKFGRVHWAGSEFSPYFDRYAEWGAGAIEVTDHHGIAAVGRTYAERNRTLGPLRTDSVWTVVEIDPMRRRVDTGLGFAPPKNVTSNFEFQPAPGADGREAARMAYKVEYAIGLGPLGLELDWMQQPGMRANMRTSMANLNTLIRSEAPNARD